MKESDPIDVAIILRKQDPFGFSIEELFRGLVHYWATHPELGIRPHLVEVPHSSSSLWKIWRNLLYVRRHSRAVNHITGDIHYAALGLPVRGSVLTVHDCGFMRNQRGWKRWVMHHLWLKWPLGRVETPTVISERTRADVCAYTDCSDGRMRVIPNYYPPRYTYHPRREISGVPVLLQIGTKENKNIPRVAEALRGMECRLVVVGRLTADQRRAVQRHAIHVEERPQLTNEALLAAYVDADAVLFASTFEGFGMPIIEAQAVGRPVITSDREPMTTVAGPGGAAFVEPESVTSIRAGIQRVLHDRSYADALVRRGLENVKRYSLPTIAARYAALYRKTDDVPVARTPQSGVLR